MQEEISNHTNLHVIEGEVSDLLLEKTRVTGVTLADGRSVCAGAVVLTTGTFLRGLIHIGERQIKAGRMGELLAIQRHLCAFAFAIARLRRLEVFGCLSGTGETESSSKAVDCWLLLTIA